MHIGTLHSRMNALSGPGVFAWLQLLLNAFANGSLLAATLNMALLAVVQLARGARDRWKRVG